MIPRAGIVAGILAGGRASRLGGSDKAWHEFEGQPLIERTLAALSRQGVPVIIASGRSRSRHAALTVPVVADLRDGQLGPLAGIEALLAACESRWLLTVPVDLLCVPADLVKRFAAQAGPKGAFAADDDGDQPLIALWPVDAARSVVAESLERGARAVHRVQAELAMARLNFDRYRFGNLNSPGDFLRADSEHDHDH